MSSSKLVLGAAVIAVLLTGCGAQPTPQSSPTPSPSQPASSSPSPAPSPAPTKPSLYSLVLSPDGLGPLVPGQAPPVTDPALDILVYDPEACAFVPEWDPSGTPPADTGLWISNYGVDPSTNDPGPFGVLIVDGKIHTIGIYDHGLETTAGAHLGMTRDELLAVYPTGITLETENYGLDTYRLRGTSGDLIFTLWENTPGVFTVNQINISTPGFGVPLGGSDYGLFGVCYGP